MSVRSTDLKGNKTYFLRHDQTPELARPGYAFYEREGLKEETVCLLGKWDRYVDKAGNVCDVPLATTRVLHTQGHELSAQEMYQRNIHADHIRAGSYPVDVCPYAQNQEYKALIGRDRLIPCPPGVTPCEGAENGCEHMQALIASRRKATREESDKAALAQSSMNGEQIKLFMKELGAGLAEGMQPKAKAHKGDKE